MEMNSTSLGDTLFYMDGPFPWYTKDNYAYAELGKASFKEGSILGALIEGINVKAENVLIGVVDGDSVAHIAPYNHNHDIYQMPGEIIQHQHEIKYDEAADLRSTFELKTAELKPNPLHRYVAYNGKDKILVTQDDERQHAAQKDGYAYHVENNWKVSFYIKNGTYASFDFSKEVSNKNFSGTEITDMKAVQKIVMRDEYEFGFNVRTDGQIYAEEKICRVTDKKLYYPLGAMSYDFLIEETIPGKEKEVDLFLRVKSDGSEYPQVDSVSIKELLEMDVTSDDTL